MLVHVVFIFVHGAVRSYARHHASRTASCPVSTSVRWCDSTWTPDMSRDECIEFVSRAVSLAVGRDGSSGGDVAKLTCIEPGRSDLGSCGLCFARC